MPKALDPKVVEVLKSFGFGKEAVWDCHGTWVIYHNVLEQIAAKAGIKFDAPIVLEANGPAKSVALCVTGRLYKHEVGQMGEKSWDRQTAEEWSIGEAAPGNNKNAYPYAMAEKRAKDRVILKLIGLHGLAYSEDEADDFKASAPATEPPKQDKPASEAQKLVADALIVALRQARTRLDLQTWGKADNTQAQIADLPQAEATRVREAYKAHEAMLLDREAA